MDAQLTIVDVTGSTNDDLLEAGKQGAPHGTGLAARAQTAGRGRRGHKWDSTAGNLLLSIVLRPCVNPAKYSGLAAVSGLAVLEALEKQGLANEIGLKWPNDLVARGRKLGGILVEAARGSEGKPFAVCGIGVNVNYTPQEVPDGGLPAIGLSDLNENVPAVDVLLKEVYHAVVNAVYTWAERLNAMEEDAGPLAPSTANTSVISIGLGSTLSPVPLPVTSWHAASFKRSMTLVARASRQKTTCDPSFLRRHHCVPWANKASQPPIRLHCPGPQGHHSKQKSPATVMAAGLCKL